MPSLLGVIQQFLRLVLIAVTGSPTLQLVLCPPTEFQQFLPVLLKEVQDPGNDRILLLLRVTESAPIHMDMEATGAGLMAGIAQADRFLENLGPGHFFHVIVQGHGMADQLEAFIQGTIVLAVEVFQAVAVGSLQDLLGPVIILAAEVDFQLHAEVPGAIATK